jgi:hypothetical protein
MPESGRSRTATRGQRATFTDTSPVFELNVWNREANLALPGPTPGIRWAKTALKSRHSRRGGLTWPDEGTWRGSADVANLSDGTCFSTACSAFFIHKLCGAFWLLRAFRRHVVSLPALRARAAYPQPALRGHLSYW